MVLTSEDVESKYQNWLTSKKSWFCANSSRVDEVLHYLLLEKIISSEEKRKIEDERTLTAQFTVTYNAILRAGSSKINTVIGVLQKAHQDDVVDEFVQFKEQNMSATGAGVVNQMLTSMSIQEMNEKYKSWMQSQMQFFCDNSSRLDEILNSMNSKKMLSDFQKQQIESARGYSKKFALVYDIVKQLGVESLDSIIDVMGSSKQEDIQDEFIKFKKENNLASFNTVGPSRTNQDKPLISMSRAKKIRMMDPVDDTIDFVHNMQPLEVVVKESMEYLDNDNRMVYKMRSNPKGFALIINNINFDDPLRSRSGAAEKDTEYAKSLLQQLNYRIMLKENVHSSEMQEVLENFKQKFEENNVDSCIVILMSHGGNNTFELTDGTYIHIWQDIIYKFDNHSCPQLVGKPKIFIVQACQNFEPKSLRTSTDSVPLVSDILVCYSTIPGHVAHRDKYLGSWYIYCLTKVFMENAHNMEITKMLQKIANETMMKVKSEDDLLQVSTYQPILFREFYFNPGL